MVELSLTAKDRATLIRWAGDERNLLRANRARAILDFAQGDLPMGDIARLCGVHPRSVLNWIARFREAQEIGVKGLHVHASGTNAGHCFKFNLAATDHLLDTL